MPVVLPKDANHVIKKIYRPRQEIARTRIAFQELTKPLIGKSQRDASQLLKVPRSTIQSWETAPTVAEIEAEVDQFFTSPVGSKYLHKIVLAATTVISFGGSGVRGVQEFLRLSKLNHWVASSTGALYEWIGLVEEKIALFGQEQTRLLAKDMPLKRISIAEDESFHHGRPCLVAIEAVSNFILVERYVKERSKEMWDLAVSEGLKDLHVKIVQSTSDEGKAILSHVNHELNAEHSPDLFNVQQELTRAIAAPLNAQEREFESLAEKAKQRLERSVKKHGEGSSMTIEAERTHRCRNVGLDFRKKRRQKVKEAIKQIGRDYHPIDITTGQWRKPEEVKTCLEKSVEEVETACREAVLSESSQKRVRKAKGTITTMVGYLVFFFHMLREYTASLQLSPEQEKFLMDVLIPLAYMERVYVRGGKDEKAELQVLIDALRKRAREGPWSEEERKTMTQKAKEAAGFFQRSSSCVEGRNAWLRMKHEEFHRLSDRKLTALTVMHNFHVRRQDGTTPAERFFGKSHINLFEWLVDEVQMLGWPRKARQKLAA